jgi:eukaryotic-like serine/threonine-protein kinase
MIVGKTVGGKYQVIELIRQQRFYDVYLARLKDSDQRVVLKWVKKELVEPGDTFRRLKSNLSVIASLRHQHIASLRDFGEDESIYLVEDFFECATLREGMERAGGINALQALNLGIRIVDALSAAHAKNIVHGQLTPESILVSGDLVPRVADMYVLHALTSELKTSSEFQGRDIRYCSPEIISGSKPTFESDVYSVGVILYELITGKLPFEYRDSLSLALEKVQIDVKSPRELNPDVPRLLESVILKCIKRKPESRYKNARELLSELYLCRSSIIRAAAETERPDNPIRESQPQTTGTEVPVLSPAPVETPAQNENITSMNELVNRKEGMADMTDKQRTGTPNGGRPPAVGSRPSQPVATASGVPAQAVQKTKKQAPKGMIPFFIALGVFILLLAIMLVYISDKLGGPSISSIIVPNVVGKSVVEAKSVLGNAGLVPVEADRQTSLEIPRGYIISQRPDSGTKVRRGRQIQLIISTGQEKVTVPKLTGLKIEDAIDLLEKSDLKPGEQQEDYSDKFKPGIVMDQNPAAGEERDSGYPVNLIVSKGIQPDMVTMPRVTDMSESEARNLLGMNNLANIETKTIETGNALPDNVVAQNVLEGTSVPVDQRIILYLTKAPESESIEEVKGVVNIDVSGEEKQEVVVMVYDQNGSHEAYRNIHSGGDKVKVPLSGFGKINIMVYLDGVLFREQTL